MNATKALARLDRAVADRDLVLAIDLGVDLAVSPDEPDWARYPEATEWYEEVFLKEYW